MAQIYKKWSCLRIGILDYKIATLDELQNIEKLVKDEIKKSAEFAQNSEFPDERSLYENIYS